VQYPSAYKDGQYCNPVYPPVNKANGLINAICHYTDWMGGVGNRINTEGRLIMKETTGVMGTFVDKKRIKSSTKRGTADVDLTLPNGVVIKGEIKAGNDKPSPKQIEMQQKVRAAKGHYEFFKTMEEFYECWDKLCP
jgi:hypothetical protein